MRSKQRWGVLLLGCASITAFAAYWLGTTYGAPERSRGDAKDDPTALGQVGDRDLKAMRAVVSRLHARVDGLSERRDLPPRVPEHALELAEPPTLAAPTLHQLAAADEEQLNKANVQTEQLFDGLTRQFQREGESSAWGEEVVKSAEDGIKSNQLSDVRVHSVDCRQTLCRLMIEGSGLTGHSNVDRVFSLLPAAGGHFRPDLSGPVEEGMRRVEVFISKR
ncbi:MAG: hypothetical protein SFV15_00290 [Polyangiaceae bacterium]|nr:hypothetical protein [Polyangiaceae bacterium]